MSEKCIQNKPKFTISHNEVWEMCKTHQRVTIFTVKISDP